MVYIMKNNDFNSNLRQVQNLLSSFSLLKDATRMFTLPKTKYYNINSTNDFVEIYRRELLEFNYSFLLKDDSFFQFYYEKENDIISKLRYTFFQFPYDIPDYEQFVKEICHCKLSESGYQFSENYSQSLDEANLKEYLMILRYDYSEKDYKEGVHSVSHIHIGYSNSMRLTIDKQISPYTFTLFVLKQIYHSEWMEIMEDNAFRKILSYSKENCSSLEESRFFSSLDKCELYFT